MANTETTRPALFHSQRPDTVSPHGSSLHSPCRCPEKRRFKPNGSKANNQKSTTPSKRSIRAFSHLHLQCPSLDLRDALGDDEGNTVTGTAGYLSEISAKQLQTALQLLMTTLDRQSFQTALVARQETLRKQLT